MRRWVFAALLVVVLPGASRAEEVGLLNNPDFQEWKDGLPVGWTVSVGATNGAGKPSEVSKGSGGGLRLSGNADTKEWRMVRQTVALPAGSVVRLRGEARAIGLTLDKNQFVNAWVGIGSYRPDNGK